MQIIFESSEPMVRHSWFARLALIHSYRRTTPVYKHRHLATNPLIPDPSPRTLSIPLYLSRVACGFPSPAGAYLEGHSTTALAHPAVTFYLRAGGESMTGVGIFSGDLLVVDKSLTPRHGDVVIALLDGGFTVKTLQLKPRLRLLPGNPAFAPIDPCMSLSLELFGVVTHVIGNLRQRDGHSAR